MSRLLRNEVLAHSMYVLWDKDAALARLVEGHIEALTAEVARLTEHAQQVEVMHSSAAVLGYVACYVGDLRGLSSISMQDTLEGITDYIGDRPNFIVPAAVVRVGADGRIGGPA